MKKWSHSWSSKEIQIKMKYILFLVELANILKKWKLTPGESVAEVPIVTDHYCPWESSLIEKCIQYFYFASCL